MDEQKPVAEQAPAPAKRKGILGFLTQPIGAMPVQQRRGIRRVLHIPRTPIGIVGGMLLSAWLGVSVMMLLPFSESTAFCTTCHTMVPQQKAHEAGPHAEVDCGHCHVTPTAEGWIRAKIGGMYELYSLATNTYERPIASPERYVPVEDPDRPQNAVFTRAIPPVEDTCLHCHKIESLATEAPPVKLMVSTRFLKDLANTKQVVSVTIRPSALSSTAVDMTDLVGDNEQGVVSVHWHYFKDLKIYGAEATNGPIPLMQFTNTKGQTVSFIDASQVGVTNSVASDIQRLENKLSSRPIDCIDCHNRVGHAIADVEDELDDAMAKGEISPSLPWVKRDATKLASAKYESDEAADAAIDAWAKDYKAKNPKYSATLVDEAAVAIKAVYHELSTPGMNTDSKTYIDNMGHNSGPGTGCWRCHDGKHVRVVEGKLTNKVVPSTCSTCHSFPQIGPTAQMSTLATPPVNHQSNLWVFSHKNSVTSLAAAFQQSAGCGTCHAKSYCTECHDTGAAKVTHDEMLFSHGASARSAGLRACATCHQGTYCSMCHGPEMGTIIGRYEARVLG